MAVSKKRFIIDQIKKSGIPLELEITSIINSIDGWATINDNYFFDNDLKKHREFDILAGVMAFATNYPFELNMLIQCKKIPGNVWVFFKTKVFPIYQIFYELTYFEIAKAEPEDARFDVFNEDKLHFKNSDTTATRYVEIITDADKSNKRTDNIFSSAMTLIKAMLYRKRRSIERENELIKKGLLEGTENLDEPFSSVKVFYPVIVFDGDVYEADIIKRKIIIKPVKYIKLLVSHEDYNFCIDVVTKDYFESYLKETKKDFLIFKKRIDKVSKKWDSGIMEIFDNYKMKVFEKLRKSTS